MTKTITRRSVLKGAARTIGVAALAGIAPGLARSAQSGQRWDTIVIGAGVFGSWSAWHLQRKGHRVLLVDAWGPAHARASSGGESRLTRAAYDSDEIYARMAWDSLADWKWLSARAALPVFHPAGVLSFSSSKDGFAETMAVHERLDLPTQTLDRAELSRRFPQVAWDGIESGVIEPAFGVLMARRAVQTLMAEFVKGGGEYVQRAARPLEGEGRSAQSQLDTLVTLDGARLAADRYVFACGPWLPKLFPETLGARIFPTRQEIFFFAPEAGDARFGPERLPGWIEKDGDYYGMPDLEARGFKIASDAHGPLIDPDVGDRQPSAEGLARARSFLRKRFPDLAARPLVESRVCQYENSSNGDLLIDRHPRLENVWLVGAGSGHGFKHGPAVGRYTAELIAGHLAAPEPRFSLASKASVHKRGVY